MSSATDEEIARLETPYDDDAIDPPECAVCGHEFIFELGAEAEVAVCHDCASEALPRLLKRVRADAAKIARLEAEMKRLRTVAIAAGRWAAAYAHTEEESSALDELLAALDGAKEGG